ncbi:MAG TPA: 3-oxoacyl-ACP reductase FabG [Kofleriaceae bacterium]|nr:3-oxoacyl-ACP reductase FabG [Kofleriaceae bacterium]
MTERAHPPGRVPDPPVALVTGASRGIGAAVARTLARDGHDVAVSCVDQRAAAEAVADEVRALGRRAWVLQFDVTQAAPTRAALDRLLGETEVHVVVNNAGVTADAAFPALDAPAWHRVLDTSLDGFFHVTQPLIMPMARRRWGRIVNLSSIAGIYGHRGQVNYATAKAGLIGATKALALELASRHITVNAVAPGPIDTDMLTPAVADEIVQHVPMRRIGTAQEVAEVIAFLVSARASYLTGQVLSVAGGL